MSSIHKPNGEKYRKITFYACGRRIWRSLRAESKAYARKIKRQIDKAFIP